MLKLKNYFLILGLSMIGLPGIARRKSNVGQGHGEARASYNSQHSNRTLNTTFESSQDELVLTERRTISGSRPTSGHHYMLATSTPSHSRSPSMTSNRDSVISNEEGITFDPKH